MSDRKTLEYITQHCTHWGDLYAGGVNFGPVPLKETKQCWIRLSTGCRFKKSDSPTESLINHNKVKLVNIRPKEDCHE